MKSWTRKEFLKASLVTGGAALLARSRAAAAVAAPGSANGDIRVAVIGVRSQGAGHARTYYKMPGTRLVALCDADSDVLARRVQEASVDGGVTVKAYADYRKLLDDPEIDVVVLGTPNHWHSLMTIQACQAGKDVYVEKPLSHNVWEGRQAVAAAAKYSQRIVVAGTQNRSSHDIAEAIAYVRAGNLGKIQWARALCYKPRDSIGRTTGPQPVPASINYDLWTGPAELTPPRRNSPRNGPVHYEWHWFWNYGGGDILNQGIHQMDVARWFLGEPGLPPTAMSIGGRFGYLDDAETPNTQIAVLGYAKAPLIFEVRGLPTKAGMKAMDAYRGTRIGVVVQCEGGYVTISEGGTANIYDNQNVRIRALTQGGNGEHRRNFVKALQQRKVTHGFVEDSHLSSSLCHLANVSHLLGTEKSNAAIAESIAASATTKESFERMLEHLKANEVNVAATDTVIGPLLHVDAATEKFTGKETEIVAAANRCPIAKRVGRAPFVIPHLDTTRA